MNVVSYLAGVPSPHKSPHKVEVLKRFVDGVNKAGDTGIAHSGRGLVQSDVAVIQGWVHQGSPNTPHLLLRKQVADTQKAKGKRTIIVDSNLFNYTGIEVPHYSRYSMDGIFPTTGSYFWDHSVDPKRWEQIQKHYGISLKPYRKSGNHILICLQRNGGWSMKGLNVPQWLNETVKKIKKISDRPIVVRGHPGDKGVRGYLKPSKDYTISNSASILQDFNNAWAVVTYNSSPGVAAAIEGIPTFVLDPQPETSQAFAVSNKELGKIETPLEFDREEWIQKISMCHWHFDELSNGTAWRHMRKFI